MFSGGAKDMISKRKLRFVHMTPLFAVCEYCNTHFEGGEEEVRQQFQSHKCERHDAVQDAGQATQDTDPASVQTVRN